MLKAANIHVYMYLLPPMFYYLNIAVNNKLMQDI